MVSQKPRFGGGSKMDIQTNRPDDIVPTGTMSSDIESTRKCSMVGQKCCLFRDDRKCLNEEQITKPINGSIETQENTTACIRSYDKLVASAANDENLEPSRDASTSSVFQIYSETEDRWNLQTKHSFNSPDGVDENDTPEFKEKSNEVDGKCVFDRFGNDLTVKARMLLNNLETEEFKKVKYLFEEFAALNINCRPIEYTRLVKVEEITQSNFDEDISRQSDSSDDSNQVEKHKVIYCKNLFVRDKKKQFYLVITDGSCSVDLKALKEQLKVNRNLSFVNNEDMFKILQCKPGEVTPLAMMHKSSENVRIIFHDSLSRARRTDSFLLAFHPLSPLLQVNISFNELQLFLTHYNKILEVFGDSMVEKSPPPQRIISSEKKDPAPRREKESIVKNENKEDTNNFKMPLSTFNSVEKRLKGERKGKLKSYLKKNSDNGRDQGGAHSNISDPYPSSEIPASPASYLDQTDEKLTETECVQQQGPKKIVNSYEIPTPKEPIPEITQFYESINKYSIVYKEVDISAVNSNEVGPSLGVRVFLLKDRRDNYFLIISHEFYELDYGRLKAVLKPKKKLDHCDSTEVMYILGVDKEHFTPFAAMSTKAKEKDINIFITEKIITSPNIILCVQHPFARGFRIVIKSYELRRLLENYSKDNFVGIVEEKNWPRKYMRPFTQFDENPNSKGKYLNPTCISSDKTKNCKTTISCKENAMAIQENDDVFSNRNVIDSVESSRSSGLCDDILNGPEQQEESADNTQFYYTLQRVVQNIHSVCLSYCYKLLRSSTETFHCQRSSSVDAKVKPELCSQTLESDAIDQSHESSQDTARFSLDSITNEEMEIQKEIKIYSEIRLTRNAQVFDNSTNHFPNKMKQVDVAVADTFDDIDDNSMSSVPSTISQSGVTYTFDNIIHGENAWQQYNKNARRNIRISDIQDELIKHGVCFKLVYGLDQAHNTNCDNDCVKDDDGTFSQECSTVHMIDESHVHYIIIGMENEHIPIKRFCRRFQISKKVYLIDDRTMFRQNQAANDKLEDFGYTNHVVNINNPFVSFLSVVGIDNINSNTRLGSKRSHKFKLVLFSSVYMDPDMTCIFELNNTGTCLLMTAQQLEDYAKRTGMEVWYMP